MQREPTDAPKDADAIRQSTSILIEDPRYRIKPMQQVISALIGGLITTFVVTPLEVVKTRVQTQQTQQQNTSRKPLVVSKLCYVFHNGLMTHVCKSKTGKCVPKLVQGEAANLRPLRGAMDAFVKILCSNGVTGLWSGLSPTLVSALPSTIIYFLTYEYLKQSFTHLYRLWQPPSPPSPPHAEESPTLRKTNNVLPIATPTPSIVPMASGICARTVVVTAITPLEMVRIKMQSGYITYTELWIVIRSLIKSHGILGLWRGWPPTVMRDAPFSGTYWAAYESMKRVCNVTEPSFLFSFVTGAAAGALATLVTMPFDLVTTHTQIELGQDVLYSDAAGHGKGGGTTSASASAASPTPTVAKQSVISRISRIYRQQGVRGLYVGVLPRMLRVVPACAIMISAFEYSKSFFFHHNLDLQEASYRRAH
ncbi:probable mitochondrial glutathione transporter SLC25A40 isoform X2 [Drosophila sulfurigaster albostrigata]|uniref:probable mitochondrial glutathione transporter SLC25A40 isoform X2 n=1 Tax=Drosophila sulfurigaster albostrigata TaxID=89887 RepID=UPI002D21C658|nr:probable mitochondrial glutathione transporter SLC25A40 isoform X2 [Drosophila sulfurigaster albostrigata]